MIGRADIEGSKSNVAMNAWLPQASYPCGTVVPSRDVRFRILIKQPGLYSTVKTSQGSGVTWSLSSLGLLSKGPDYILSPIPLRTEPIAI